MREFLAALLFFISIAVPGQPYKRWFTDQYLAGCPGCAVGMVEPAGCNDSIAVYQAFLSGCTNYVKQKRAMVSIDKNDWGTESGTVSIEDNYTETIDSVQLADALQKLVILDTLFSKNFIAVLVGSNACSVDEFLKEKVSVIGSELAVSRTEKVLEFTGMSPRYAYERSSWDEAETRARREAAFYLDAKVSSIGRLGDMVFDERRKQKTRVELRNVFVLKRRIDKTANLFYVTIRLE